MAGRPTGRKETPRAGARGVTDPIFTTSAGERLQPFFQRMCEPRPFRARTKTEWLERRGEVRNGVFQALGLQPMPDRIPLNVHAGGILQRDGYRVERLYWQSWPGVWTSGGIRTFCPNWSIRWGRQSCGATLSTTGFTKRREPRMRKVAWASTLAGTKPNR